MVHNTTDSLEKLACTDYVDFGKTQDRFEELFWSKGDSNYSDVKLKVVKKAKTKNFRKVENHTMGEADSKQFV